MWRAAICKLLTGDIITAGSMWIDAVMAQSIIHPQAQACFCKPLCGYRQDSLPAAVTIHQLQVATYPFLLAEWTVDVCSLAAKLDRVA